MRAMKLPAVFVCSLMLPVFAAGLLAGPGTKFAQADAARQIQGEKTEEELLDAAIKAVAEARLRRALDWENPELRLSFGTPGVQPLVPPAPRPASLGNQGEFGEGKSGLRYRELERMVVPGMTGPANRVGSVRVYSGRAFVDKATHGDGDEWIIRIGIELPVFDWIRRNRK